MVSFVYIAGLIVPYNIQEFTKHYAEMNVSHVSHNSCSTSVLLYLLCFFSQVCLGAEAEDKLHTVEIEGVTYDGKTTKIPLAVLKPSILPSVSILQYYTSILNQVQFIDCLD